MYNVRDTKGHDHIVHQPASDIDNLVQLSVLRCGLTVFGLLLVLTDIPRTGFAVDLFEYYPKVAPDTAMYYGPYAYPVIHLNQSASRVEGYSGGVAVDSVDVWSYKYDSMSVPTRALAQLLNVTSYPRCVLYDERHCTANFALSPEVAFTMLDDLIGAIHRQYFLKTHDREKPMLFSTRSAWADRLHHVVLGSLSHRIDRRTHSVHFFTANASLNAEQSGRGINICQQFKFSEIMQPRPCSGTVAWIVDHPTSPSDPQLPLWESVNIRFGALQAQYPNAIVDVTVITTQSVLQNLRNAFVPTVTFLSENIEVTTFIRGRRCVAKDSCTTIFLDDYRYERATVETSSDELKVLTGMLRGFSQAYVWLRVCLLIFASSRTRLAEYSNQSKHITIKTWIVCSTIARIPSHVLVYTSWVPLVGYSLAHFIDCGLVHLISDSFWSSHNGLISFNIISYIAVGSIQMRNIWAIGLSWKTLSLIHTHVFQHRGEKWRAQTGILAFRGVFIGTASLLTIFSFLRFLRFRDTRVLSVCEHPRHHGVLAMLNTQQITNTSDFGHRLDAKTAGLATGIVFVTLLLLQVVVRKCFGAKTRFLLCRSYYVPLGAGTLYPASSLSVFWFMHLVASSNYSASARMPSFAATVRRLRSRMFTAIAPFSFAGRRRRCDVCGFISTPLQWRVVQGCRRHETLFAIGARSVETQSMVRLINIAMMSDPLVFLRLRFFGKSLFLYRVHPAVSPRAPHDELPSPSLVLSPVQLEMSGTQTRYEFVGFVDSSTVPWSLLVDCG